MLQWKYVTCADFCGIAISSTMSKVFEYCVMQRFDHFLTSNDNQFDFKKGLSCSHAIYTVQKIANRLTDGGSTVNRCALDLTKALDKVNHNVLIIELMKRRILNELLDIFVYWLSNSWSCVNGTAFLKKWGSNKVV
jgi:hypothetical protein